MAAYVVDGAVGAALGSVGETVVFHGECTNEREQLTKTSRREMGGSCSPEDVWMRHSLRLYVTIRRIVWHPQEVSPTEGLIDPGENYGAPS